MKIELQEQFPMFKADIENEFSSEIEEEATEEAGEESAQITEKK